MPITCYGHIKMNKYLLNLILLLVYRFNYLQDLCQLLILLLSFYTPVKCQDGHTHTTIIESGFQYHPLKDLLDNNNNKKSLSSLRAAQSNATVAQLYFTDAIKSSENYTSFSPSDLSDFFSAAFPKDSAWLSRILSLFSHCSVASDCS